MDPQKDTAAKFAQIDKLKLKIKALQDEVEGIQQEIAAANCPFAVGQVILTKRGLGRDGLKVIEVIPPQFPSPQTMWAVKTLALTKAGAVSARLVTLDQWRAEADQACVKGA